MVDPIAIFPHKKYFADDNPGSGGQLKPSVEPAIQAVTLTLNVA